MTDVTLFYFALVCSTSFLSKIIFFKNKKVFFYFDISVPTFDVDVRVIEWKDQNFMKHDFSILNFSTFVFFVSVKKWPNTETEERERFPVKRKSIRLHRKKVFFGTDEKHFFPIVFFAFWSSHRHKSIFFIFHHGPKNFFVSPDLDTRYWYETFYQNFTKGMSSVLFWSSSFWAVEKSYGE